MKNSIDEALEEARAEAAFDAQSRHERGEAQPEDAAFSEAELQAMASLRPPPDPRQEAAWQAAMATALASPAAQLKPEAAIPSRGPGSVSPLRVLTRARVTVAATLAMAAALAILVLQPYAFQAEVGPLSLRPGDRVLGSSAGAPSTELTANACLGLELSLKSDSPLSDSVTAHAYLRQGSRTVRWNITPQIAETRLMLPQCAPLPAELAPGDWTLVLLVGYPGRLAWVGKDALSAAGPGARTTYRGIQVLRQPLHIGSAP